MGSFCLQTTEARTCSIHTTKQGTHEAPMRLTRPSVFYVGMKALFPKEAQGMGL
ncbi:hypothetical protein I79_009081 [Cricetulus griseus]|uniref:Uncharacterized protein n=1 Tax=Cricetulus griseus TaxID=10029 RepID=G3HET5_CRIGR|nr:hypothetical protein I79_009081 [Cricetulus griseus]